MSNQDWYRKTNWTKRDKEDFFKHLEQSRKSTRVQYLKIQAYYLYETKRLNEISAALELNNLALSENPESIFLAEIFEQKALCLNKLGKFDDAEENFLLAFQAMREFPNIKPNVPFTFGVFVIENNISRLYKKVIEILNEFDEMKSGIVLPVTEYYFYGIKAIILNREGDFVSSKPFAQKAISASEKKYSGFSRHPKVGLVDETENSLYIELVSIVNR
jgi:tetratricopeptide (TPR) repeat protein